jgi:hypothetical protein
MSTAKWFVPVRSYFSPQTLRDKRYGVCPKRADVYDFMRIIIQSNIQQSGKPVHRLPDELELKAEIQSADYTD